MTVLAISIVGFLFFQGLLLTSFLLRKKPLIPHIFLSLLIMKYSLLMLNLMLEQSNFSFSIGDLYFFNGPLVYLFLKTSRHGGRLRRYDLLLFLPLLFNIIPIPYSLLVILDLLWTTSLCIAAFIGSLKWEDCKNWYFLTPILVFFSSLISSMDFLFLSLRWIILSDFFSMLMALVEGSLIFAPAWFILYKEKEKSPIKEPQSSIKYEKNLISSPSLEKYYNQLNKGMLEEGWFREPDISLSILSERINISSVQLSQVINRKEGINFFKYINGLRIKEVCHLLDNGDKRTIMEIMYYAGFNSKTTFNKAFRLQTGKTPGEYRKVGREKN